MTTCMYWTSTRWCEFYATRKMWKPPGSWRQNISSRCLQVIFLFSSIIVALIFHCSCLAPPSINLVNKWFSLFEQNCSVSYQKLIFQVDYFSAEYEDTASKDSTSMSPLISDLFKRSTSFRRSKKSHSSFNSFKKQIQEATSEIRNVGW